MKHLNLNVESKSHKFKITTRIKNVERNAKSTKINVCLRECRIISGEVTRCYQPQQFLSSAMIPVYFWCDSFLCRALCGSVAAVLFVCFLSRCRNQEICVCRFPTDVILELPMIEGDRGGYLDSCFMVREICGPIEFSEL